jgi:hypothetical protein
VSKTGPVSLAVVLLCSHIVVYLSCYSVTTLMQSYAESSLNEGFSTPTSSFEASGLQRRFTVTDRHLTRNLTLYLRGLRLER